jgi:hypothetical protein
LDWGALDEATGLENEVMQVQTQKVSGMPQSKIQNLKSKIGIVTY